MNEKTSDNADGQMGIEAMGGTDLAALQLASTSVDLASLGLDQLAYIRRSVINNAPVWSIHNARGDTVGAAPSKEEAWGAILQHDLQPVYVN